MTVTLGRQLVDYLGSDYTISHEEYLYYKGSLIAWVKNHSRHVKSGNKAFLEKVEEGFPNINLELCADVDQMSIDINEPVVVYRNSKVHNAVFIVNLMLIVLNITTSILINNDWFRFIKGYLTNLNN